MELSTSMYVAQGIHGIAFGMVLFLIASGLNVIFGMMGILNLAHGAFFMLSAYFCYSVISFTGNFWIALLLAPIFTAIFGIIIEKFFIRKVQIMGPMGELILTLGIAMLILAGVKFFWGTQNLPVEMPSILKGMISVGSFEYPIYRLFMIGLAFLVLIIMTLLLYKTRLGKIVRAAVSDREMVNSLGINVPLVFMFVFGIGAWMAGIAGVVIAPILTVFPGLADQVGMLAFIIVVTGGFGSLKGAFIVSIIFGLISSYGIQFFSQLAPVLMVGFMALVLAVKPHGLFGVKE